MKLEPAINFISTGRDAKGYGTFITEKNLRYIDLNNLNKYTKKQLFSILSSVSIFTNPNYKKDILISMLMNDERALNKIKADNREWQLQQLIAE